MTTVLLGIVIALLAAVIVLLIAIRPRLSEEQVRRLERAFEDLEHAGRATEQVVRDEIARSREEEQRRAGELRTEVGGSVKGLSDTVVRIIGELGGGQRSQLEAFSNRLGQLTESNEKKLEGLRAVVDQRLREMQEDNTRKLDLMRQTVDEKLQGTLEKRLGESFKLVSERLEQVHKGLGAMQQLATGVGDLKRVLSNVKTRGTWGEIQLAALLEQMLTAEQYQRNVATRPRSRERVEFAIRLPGPDEDSDEPIWLPIDAKFPMEKYETLMDAYDRADPPACEKAGKELEAAVKLSARTIRDKYVNPPCTTDFAILFLPTEGLYAEVLRRPGLVDQVQRDCRITITGPTTLAALLNALQVGFRTLAIQKRSSEVWKILSAVKVEFGKFGDALDAVHKKLNEATSKIEAASRKTRTIERRLVSVEQLPTGADTRQMVFGGGGEPDEPAEPAEAGDEPSGADEPTDSVETVRT